MGGANTRRRGRKVYSSLKDIPLQISSESFSYLPMNEAIFAHKYGNQLLLKAAEYHVEGRETVQATLNISMMNAIQRNEKVQIKSKRISNKINRIRVDSYHSFTESAKLLAALGEGFENVITICFDGVALSWFEQRDCQQLLEVELKYKKLRQIEIICDFAIDDILECHLEYFIK